jgi:MFS family permease
MRRYLQFVGGYWPLLAFGFLTIFWGNFGQSFFISWYGASIQESLNISATTYGSIYSLATLASGLSIMAIGGAIDQWPLRRFVVAVAVGLTAAALVLWQVQHVWMLCLGFYLVRLCGQGLLPHTAQTTMARQFEVNRGKALSLSASGVPFGEVVLPLLAVGLISALGWRNSWVVVAFSVPLLYLPAALGLLHLARKRGQYIPFVASTNPQAQRKAAGRREMLRDRRFWLALPSLMAGPFIVTGIFIQQSFILQQKVWTPAWLATCFIVYGVVHWLSSLATGVLVDRFTAQRVLPVMIIPLGLAMFVTANLEGMWVAPLFMGLMGITIGAAGPVSGALWAEVYGTEKLGSIRSLVTSLMILTTALAPVVFGAMIDAGQTVTQMLNVMGAGIVVAVVMAFFSYRPR